MLQEPIGQIKVVKNFILGAKIVLVLLLLGCDEKVDTLALADIDDAIIEAEEKLKNKDSEWLAEHLFGMDSLTDSEEKFLHGFVSQVLEDYDIFVSEVFPRYDANFSPSPSHYISFFRSDPEFSGAVGFRVSQSDDRIKFCSPSESPSGNHVSFVLVHKERGSFLGKSVPVDFSSRLVGGEFQSFNMTEFANWISGKTNMRIKNGTNLEGDFNFSFRFPSVFGPYELNHFLSQIGLKLVEE